METSGRYVDTYDLGKNYGEYTVLGDDIDVQAVMKGGETEELVVQRSKRGLEKVFGKLKGKEEGLPIVMIHGGVMTVFSNEFFKGEVGKIKNSDLWDLDLFFDESGKFVDANLIEKIAMDDSLKKEFYARLDSLEPSESLLDKQDFSPIEEGLSILVNKLKEQVKKTILDSYRTSKDNVQEQHVGMLSEYGSVRSLSALAAPARPKGTTTTTTTTTTKLRRSRSLSK